MSTFLFALALLFLGGAYISQTLRRLVHLPPALCTAAGILAISAGAVEWIAYDDLVMGITYAAIGVVYLALAKRLDRHDQRSEMSWNLSASGHAADAVEEADTIRILQAAVKSANAGSATIFTQHHGTVDLMVDETVPPHAQ